MKAYKYILISIFFPILCQAQPVEKVVDQNGTSLFRFAKQIQTVQLNQNKVISFLGATYHPNKRENFKYHLFISLVTRGQYDFTDKQKQQTVLFHAGKDQKFKINGTFNMYNESVGKENLYMSNIELPLSETDFKKLAKGDRVSYAVNNLGFGIDATQTNYFEEMWTIDNPVIEKEWKTIERFSGSGIKNTAPFSTSKNEWRIVYKSQSNSSTYNDGTAHLLQLILLKPGEEMIDGEIIVNEVNKLKINGSTFIYKKGRFYIRSNSANGDWEVEIQIKK